MSIAAKDIVPLTHTRARLSELAYEVNVVSDEVVTESGESYVALIDADRPDCYHLLDRERIHLLLMEDVQRGLADIVAGRTQHADAAIARLQQRRQPSAMLAKSAKQRG